MDHKVTTDQALLEKFTSIRSKTSTAFQHASDQHLLEKSSSSSAAGLSPLADRTERLRSFLTFCLVIDYDYAREDLGPDLPTVGDFRHFLSLGRRCFLR
jgi:hypothetical protein